VAMAMLAGDLPSEIVVSSVARAAFCDGLLRTLGRADLADEGFLLGLFSMIDAFLGQPLTEAVARLPLSSAVRAVLLGAGESPLRQVYDLALAWERASWAQVATIVTALDLRDDAVAERYRSALELGNAMAASRPAG